jgi:type VI secretion system protein ImpF
MERLLRQAIWDLRAAAQQELDQGALVADPLLMSHNALSFSIEAELWAQPIPLRLFLKTEIDLEDGNTVVVDAGSPG